VVKTLKSALNLWWRLCHGCQQDSK